MKRDYQNESNPILNHISFEMKNKNENGTIQWGSNNEKNGCEISEGIFGAIFNL